VITESVLSQGYSIEYLIDSGEQILLAPELEAEQAWDYQLPLKMRVCTMVNSKPGVNSAKGHTLFSIYLDVQAINFTQD
jgi:hypothetical protein